MSFSKDIKQEPKEEKKNSENNKKGFSSVLLFDVPFQQSSIYESPNQNIILNPSLDKQNSLHNLLPDDLIKKIETISPTSSNEKSNNEISSKISDIDLISNKDEEISSFDKDEDEIQLSQYENLSYKTRIMNNELNNKSNDKKNENYKHKFSSNSFGSVETRHNSYNLVNPIIDNNNNNYNNININNYNNNSENNNYIYTEPSFNVLLNNCSLIESLQRNFSNFQINLNNNFRKYSYPQNFHSWINDNHLKTKKKKI